MTGVARVVVPALGWPHTRRDGCAASRGREREVVPAGRVHEARVR